MFRKTLVCLDGSKIAEEVLPYLISVCAHQDNELVLLQVITTHITIPPPQSMHTMTFGQKTRPGMSAASDMGSSLTAEPEAGAQLAEIEKEQARARQYLESVAGRLRAQGVKVKTVVLEGDIKETVIDHIANSQVSLVAMTTHGAGGMEHGLLGSVAQYILKESPAPVLLVKSRRKVVKKEEEEY
jgi:nucleotide-binding universal stress UspA family protein